MTTETPMRLILLLTLLAACAPVRETPSNDDDATADGDTLQDRFDALEDGSCDVGWSRNGAAEDPPLPTSGVASAYYGIYFGLDCRAPSPVGIVSLFFESYEILDEATAAVTGASINDMDEDHDPREPELVNPGEVLITRGDYTNINGWWTGELVFEQDDGDTITLESVVFREATMIGVAGR